jgi:hypothetical protein
MEQQVIGVDIGGTKIAAALVSRDGRSVDYQTIPTPAQEGPTAILNGVIGLLSSLREQAGAREIEVAAIGVGTAGQVNVHSGIITYAVDILPRWAGTQIRDVLTSHFHLPVVVDNDVNAMALGELRFGAARGLKHTLYATVGTGSAGRSPSTVSSGAAPTGQPVNSATRSQSGMETGAVPAAQPAIWKPTLPGQRWLPNTLTAAVSPRPMICVRFWQQPNRATAWRKRLLLKVPLFWAACWAALSMVLTLKRSLLVAAWPSLANYGGSRLKAPYAPIPCPARNASPFTARSLASRQP